MDTNCLSCGEPWDNYHLRNDAIHDAERYPAEILNTFNGKLDETVKIEAPKRYCSIVFIQGDEADEPFRILDEQGSEAALEYLKQWDYGDGDDGQEYEQPWGSSDSTEVFGEYVLTYNTRLGYIGLCQEVNPKEPNEKTWRSILAEAGYEFGSSLYILKRCPCCKDNAPVSPEKLAIREEAALLLGDDTDGLQATLEDLNE